MKSEYKHEIVIVENRYSGQYAYTPCRTLENIFLNAYTQYDLCSILIESVVYFPSSYLIEIWQVSEILISLLLSPSYVLHL